MTLFLVAIVCFAATASLMAAVGLSVRDMSTRRYDHIDRRLGLDRLSLELGEFEPLALAPASRGWIDRYFYNLIEESGSPLGMGTALALLAGSSVVGLAIPVALLDSLLWGAAGLAVGFVTPLVWWNLRRARRLAVMRKHLPETLDMLADGVRTGRNLEQAAEIVARQSAKPLSTEFAYCASQMRLGHTPVAVLERLVRRIPLAEFRIFATAVLVHRITGGNLSLLVERLADVARERQQFNGHVKSMTAGSKLSAIGLCVGTAAAVAILSWLQPDYLRMFLTHPWGKPLLVIAGCLQLLGLVWMWRITKVEY
ncbi:MAG: type II secretion system F family protein [Pirellulales bacterium]|nr:type II secretion system F family protein [Pirellulales bacterium]